MSLAFPSDKKDTELYLETSDRAPLVPVLRATHRGGSDREVQGDVDAPVSVVPQGVPREVENFATGSIRNDRKGKGRYDLLPPAAIRRVAQHFERGAERFGDRNWEKGQPLSRLLDSGIRHAFAVLEGKTDEDHAAAAAWNILCFIETAERISTGRLPESLNDLPLTPLPRRTPCPSAPKSPPPSVVNP